MRNRTTVLRSLLGAVFALSMAFGVTTAVPSASAAQAGTICQLAGGEGNFQVVGPNAATCTAALTSGDASTGCQLIDGAIVNGTGCIAQVQVGTGPCQVTIGGNGGASIVQLFETCSTDEVPTETATETETAVPSETATETETAVVTETPVVTETADVTETATETETAVVTETPVVTETEVVTETAVETETAVVTETEVVPVVTETTTSGGGGTDTTGGSGTGTDTSGSSDSGSSVSALPDTGTGSTDSSNTTFVALFGALAAVGVGGAYALRRRTR